MAVCLANTVKDAEITVTQSASGTFAVVVQLQGENGEDLTAKGWVHWYLSTDAAGDVVATDTTDVTSLAIATDGTLLEDNVSGGIWGLLRSESDGDIGLAIVVPASKVVYLNIILPDGSVVTSDDMTYGM